MRNSSRLYGRLAAIFLLACGAVAAAQQIDMKVELLGPLGTKISHKGDKVVARVLLPDSLKGDTVEGAVRDVRSGGKFRGNSVLNFSFDSLQHAGQNIPLNTQVESFQNSQGQADVDEEGRVIRKGGGNTGKAVAGTAAGGLIGGLAGGWKGAAIGSAIGAAASITLIQITADSPEIRFSPGSIVTIRAEAKSGTPLTALSGAPPSSPPAASSASTTAAAPVPAGTATAAAQPSFVALRSDFVPGEKTLLYDDFTDMSPDEAPPHWKVRGGAVELRQAGDVREAVPVDSNSMTALVHTLPAAFTVETEVKYTKPSDSRVNWFFRAKDDQDVLYVYTFAHRNNTFRLLAKSTKEQLIDTETQCDFSQPVKQDIWVQDGRVRFYLNGKRLLDVNQVEIPAIETARVETSITQGSGAVAYRRFRIAESTPDFSHTIMASGRYVTHGILFDTDSDRLRPESAGVIRSIAFGLQGNPSLKLRIEGHTDATGNADHNVTLSKRRAEAVKTVLVSQFQIDPARLSTAGLGSTRPIASNDDALGRSQNRRVELVKE